MQQTKGQQQPVKAKQKKRIAPQKEAELSPIVSSVPNSIISASFRQEAAPPSTAGRAKNGIDINIRKTPMVDIRPVLEAHGFSWRGAPTHADEEQLNGRRTQVDVVKRILERQTRLYQVREVLSEGSDSDVSDTSEGSDQPLSDMEVSEEEGENDAEKRDPLGPDHTETKADDVEEALDEGQEEEWGVKNIGEYDANDAFIDDSEVHHYFDNIHKRSKYSGFYIHKGPLKLIQQPTEQRPTKGQSKKNREIKPKLQDDGSTSQPEKPKQRATHGKKKATALQAQVAVDGRAAVVEKCTVVCSNKT